MTAPRRAKAARRALLCLMVLVGAWAGGGAAIAAQQPAPVDKHRALRHLLESKLQGRHASSDSSLAAAESIYAHAQRRLKLLAGKSDSLAAAESLYARTQHKLELLPGLPDSVREQVIDEMITGLDAAIENISQELSNLDLRIEDQAISLRDRQSGGRIKINIPPDLGEQISKGISSITASILSDLPDTVRALRRGPGGRVLVVPRPVTPAAPLAQAPAAPIPPPPPPPPVTLEHVERRVIGGDTVRILGDIVVGGDEEVRGSAIAIFGNVVVRGRVDRDVVSVLGNVELAGGSEVGGDVTAILGRLDRAREADVAGSVFSLAPSVFGRVGNVRELLWAGWPALVARLALFLVSAALLLLLLMLTPAARLQVMLGTLTARPGACLGHGVLWLVVGHLLLVPLMAILALSLIGIPLALLLALAYFAVVLLALGVASAQFGARARSTLRRKPAGSPAQTLLGFTLLHVPGFVGVLLGLVPGLGALAVLLGVLDIALKLAALAWGLGALLLCRLGRRVAVAPVPAEPAPVS